jgi:tripartite ATP-independent transporter DctM subunit
VPGLVLVVLYMIYLVILARARPSLMPTGVPEGEEGPASIRRLLLLTLGPLLLIVAVLGSILQGVATPTEAAAVGAVGAILLALLSGHLTLEALKDVVFRTTRITAMVFMILIGASLFSLVFRGFGGDEVIGGFLTTLPGGAVTAMVLVMLVMFLLGFVLDFIEIIFVVVPIVGPVLMAMGLDPLWLGVMMAVNLQTSFLTPPFGFALFYLRGACPESVPTSAIYRGVIPFIAIQLLTLVLLALWPALITWLPGVVY